MLLTTGGGDWEECYELVLHEARTKLSWTPGTQRSLVMIGDATPHPPSYHMNTLKLDWKKEAKQLYDELGVKIYSVQVSCYSVQDMISVELSVSGNAPLSPTRPRLTPTV